MPKSRNSRRKRSFTTKERFKAIISSTITVEKRILDHQSSSTINGVNTCTQALVDIHNANFREFAEEVQQLIPVEKQYILEKLLRFYTT